MSKASVVCSHSALCVQSFCAHSSSSIFECVHLLTVNSKGDVYAKVIKEVCDASRIDFEEGGVDSSTLELMQTVSLILSHLGYFCIRV